MLWFRIWFLQCHLLDDELGCVTLAIQNHLQVELARLIIHCLQTQILNQYDFESIQHDLALGLSQK